MVAVPGASYPRSGAAPVRHDSFIVSGPQPCGPPVDHRLQEHLQLKGLPVAHEKQYRLADPTSGLFGIMSTAIMGVLPLVDTSTLTDQRRRTVHVATAVFTGLYLGITIGGKRPLPRVLVGLASAAAALRFAHVADVIDAQLEENLRRAGARHPRRWMAAGTAVFTFAGFLSDCAAARREPRTNSIEQPEQDASPQ